MLTTLIVDDEKLVRSELRRLIDWESYHIEIIGEAENGRAALHFLEEHPDTDLMFSDLTMPGISGIEFLERVRKDYPKVRIVVMTMHQDFDFVQQALRLGAVDYITKTQIERQNFGSILKNLLKRLASLPGETCCETDELTVCVNLDPGQPFHKGDALQKLAENMWLLPTGEEPPAAPQIICLKMTGVFGQSFRQLTGQIKKYLNTRLFYLYKPECKCYFCQEGELLERPDERDQTAALMKGSEWLMQDKAFQEILQKIPEMRMTREELVVFLYQPYLFCASYLHLTPTDYFTQTENLTWWYQWVQWLKKLRSDTAACLCPQDSSVYSIHKAMDYIQTNYMKDISLSDILEIAAMSKSRFSQLFKEQTGLTFGDYLKQLRIQQAQKLLANTKISISSVGVQVGYPDDRNFRRIFLETTGYTPAHYRKKNQT